uniref:class I SAM-dependent methyltransferase n=1 Tax=Flavobacterium sp. TaxID=239 RepID=UPI004049B72C
RLRKKYKELIINIIKKEKFYPGIIGFFINHNFLIRLALHKAITENAATFKGKLLDFGCGSKPYKKLFVNVDMYVGVDLKIEGREENHQYIDRFYDGNVIPFEDSTFDSLLSTEVLEHVFNIEELLAEFNRVLKKGGQLLITTPFMWEEHEMPYDFARYTTPALFHLYEKNGFEVVHNFKTGNYIEVIAQFILNYFKNILPNNKIVRQVMLIPFIFLSNLFGVFFSFILPKDQTAYFNNVFILVKKND